MTRSGPLQPVEPAWSCAPEYAQTLGPEVAELCEMAGFAPDPEQRLILDAAFALTPAGKSAAFELGVVAPRQNLKTGVFKQIALGDIYILEVPLITWSAHEFSTTKEALRDMVALIDGTPELRKRLKTVRFANDDPSIELHGGQRIKFKARTKSGGRGLTGDRVFLDEAFALTADHMGALLPTLSVVPDPQILYGSSAGLSYSSVLRGVRDRGRAGSSPRLGYFEWAARTDETCDDPECVHAVGASGCLLDRRDLWKQGNPLLGRTRANGTSLTFEYLEAEREALPPAEFARERMGWWDDPDEGEPVFPAVRWDGCRAAARPAGLPVSALAVATSIDEQSTAIVAASVDGDGLVWVKVLESGPGRRWAGEALSGWHEQFGVPVVLDSHSPAASLSEMLERAGVEVRSTSTAEFLDACAGFQDRVLDGALRHVDSPELDAAVAAAVKRTVGDRWAWGRRKSTADISALEAATLAVWATGSVDPAGSVSEFLTI